MKRVLAFALPLLLFGACATSARELQVAGAPLRAPTETSALGDEPDQGLLGRGLGSLTEGLVAEGYRVKGRIERGFLAPSARAVQSIVIEPGVCVAIIALASASVLDLDAALYGADGTVLAEDDTTGARPIVRLCNGERHIEGYLSFYAFQGTGSFAAVRLERPLSGPDALAVAERALEPVATDRTPAFGELLRSLHVRGYEDDGPITEVPIASDSAVRLACRVQAGRCYGVVADGSRMRVRLLDGEGRELALGVGNTGPAALQYCAHEDADLLLELSAQGPERSVRLARLRAGQAAVGAARAVWLGEPSASGVAFTRDAKQSRAAACAGKAQPLASGIRLAQGAAYEHKLTLRGCTRIEVDLSEGLSVVTLRIEDAAGAALAESDVLAPLGELQVCAREVALPVQLTLIGRAGFGAASLRSQPCAD